MRIEIKTYILSDNGEYLDQFENETFQMTRVNKDVFDLDNVYGDYSQPIKIPATRNNNRIFANYYSLNTFEVFNTAFSYNAEIYVDGVLFNTGRVRLISADVSNGEARSYQIQYFSNLLSLKDILKDNKLSDVDFSDYSHSFTDANVKAGLTGAITSIGASIRGNLRYPLISTDRYWVYKPDDAYTYPSSASASFPVQYNVAKNAGAIYKEELRPSLSVDAMMVLIYEQYGIEVADKLYVFDGTNDSGIVPNTYIGANYQIRVKGYYDSSANNLLVSNRASGSTNSMFSNIVTSSNRMRVVHDGNDYSPAWTYSNGDYYDIEIVCYNSGTTLVIADHAKQQYETFVSVAHTGTNQINFGWGYTSVGGSVYSPSQILFIQIDGIEYNLTTECSISGATATDRHLGSVDLSNYFMHFANGNTVENISSNMQFWVKIGGRHYPSNAANNAIADGAASFIEVVPNMYNVDIDSERAWTTSTSSYVVPSSGTYSFACKLTGFASSAATTPDLLIYKNGVLLDTLTYDSFYDGLKFNGTDSSVGIVLAESDVIEFRVKWYEVGANYTTPQPTNGFWEIPDYNANGCVITRGEINATQLPSSGTVMNLKKFAPDMTVLDFLKAIAKMFNCVVYFNNQNQLVIRTWEEWITEGSAYNFSRNIDLSRYDVSTFSIFSRMSLGYAQDEEDALNIAQNNVSQNKYGRFSLETGASFGKELKVDLDFGATAFTNIINKTNDAVTNVCSSFYVDSVEGEDVSSVDVSPRIFYYNGTESPVDITSGTGGLRWLADRSAITENNYEDNDGGTKNDGCGNNAAFEEITSYSLMLMEDSSNTSSLLFNETYSAFDYVVPSENQTRFYDTFLLNTTDPNRRILKFTGYLRSQDLIDRLKLNNTIYINNEEFTINKYDVQLNTGKVELEVIYVSNDDVGMQQVINQAKLNIND